MQRCDACWPGLTTSRDAEKGLRGRLRMCRGLYAYVLESRKMRRSSPGVSRSCSPARFSSWRFHRWRKCICRPAAQQPLTMARWFLTPTRRGRHGSRRLRPLAAPLQVHCRLCHVDVGFAMRPRPPASAPPPTARLPLRRLPRRQKTIDGKTVFASCSDNRNDKQCARCHSLRTRPPESTITNPSPQNSQSHVWRDWEAAERSGAIKPVDFIEGVSVKRRPCRAGRISPSSPPTPGPSVLFSHEKHAI